MVSRVRISPSLPIVYKKPQMRFFLYFTRPFEVFLFLLKFQKTLKKDNILPKRGQKWGQFLYIKLKSPLFIRALYYFEYFI